MLRPHDYDLLVKSAEIRRLMQAIFGNTRQPSAELVPPQIERKWLEPCQQRTPEVAERMPETGQRVVHQNDLSSRLDHAHELTQCPFTVMARLLVQKKERQSLVVRVIRQIQLG